MYQDLRISQMPPDIRVRNRLSAEEKRNQRYRRRDRDMKRAPQSTHRCNLLRNYRYARNGAHSSLAAQRTLTSMRYVQLVGSAAYRNSKPPPTLEQQHFASPKLMSYSQTYNQSTTTGMRLLTIHLDVYQTLVLPAFFVDIPLPGTRLSPSAKLPYLRGLRNALDCPSPPRK